MQRVLGHQDGVASATFSPDGQQVVTASWDGTARIWNVEIGEVQRTWRGTGVESLACPSVSTVWVVTASHDQTVRIWNVATGEEQRTLEHEDGVTNASFSPDGQRVVTASWDVYRANLER